MTTETETKDAAFLRALDGVATMDERDTVCAAHLRCERCGDTSPMWTVCGPCRAASRIEGIEEGTPGEAR